MDTNTQFCDTLRPKLEAGVGEGIPILKVKVSPD